MNDITINQIGLAIIIIGIVALVSYGLYNNWKKDIYNQRKKKKKWKELTKNT